MDHSETISLADALRDETLVWQLKPVPFQHEFAGESREEWPIFEKATLSELESLKDSAESFYTDNKEVKARDFVFRGRNVRYEQFLTVDLALKDPFEHCSIEARVNARLAAFDQGSSRPSIQAAQLRLGQRYIKMGDKMRSAKGHFVDPKKNIQANFEELWGLQNGLDEWAQLKDQHTALLRSSAALDKPLQEILVDIEGRWPVWARKADNITRDHVFNKKRNSRAFSTEGILREPPKESMYIAIDKKGKLLVFIDPKGLVYAYDEATKARMEADTRLLFRLKPANAAVNQRHQSIDELLKQNPHIRPEQCGTDHWGPWHSTGHPNGPMYESADLRNLTADERRLLLQYLSNCNGVMTRPLHYWMGVLDPQLRDEYARVYQGVLEDVRLPPTNDRIDEIFTLRAAVVNRLTDEHIDRSDYKGGLIGLVPIGTFQGGGFGLKQLGIKLTGYGSGALALFRGRNLRHFIGPWTGRDRCVFDFTNHQSVAVAVQKMIRRAAAGAAEEQNTKKPLSEEGGTSNTPQSNIRVSSAKANKTRDATTKINEFRSTGGRVGGEVFPGSRAQSGNPTQESSGPQSKHGEEATSPIIISDSPTPESSSDSDSVQSIEPPRSSSGPIAKEGNEATNPMVISDSPPYAAGYESDFGEELGSSEGSPRSELGEGDRASESMVMPEPSPGQENIEAGSAQLPGPSLKRHHSSSPEEL